MKLNRVQKISPSSIHVFAVQQVKKSGVPLTSSPELVKETIKTLDFSGKKDSFTLAVSPVKNKQLIALVGIGESTSPQSLRDAAAVAVRNLHSHSSLTLDFGDMSEDQFLATCEGALMGAYRFDTYKSTPETLMSLKVISVFDTHREHEKLITEAVVVAEAVHVVKNLVNTPPNDLYPASFTTKAKKLIDAMDISSVVWDEKKLSQEGFGGLVGVGQGSSRPPRLVKLEYKPKKSTFHLSLVGKGITFDTGGLSLKTGAGMIGMKYDMTGAATALGVIRAVAQLKLPLTMTAWLCLAENMPSGTATRPNDVLKIYGGKTVEVLNTDAEGRLVLADGLTKASEENPDLIIDIATLTGAATTALGTRYTGAMGDADAISHLLEIGELVGEQFWHMPLPEELRAYLNSDLADIANVKPGNTAAGMLVGATFLREFIGKKSKDEDSELIPWIHLDIANTANNSGNAYGVTPSGPTGVTVRTLIKLAQHKAQK